MCGPEVGGEVLYGTCGALGDCTCSFPSVSTARPGLPSGFCGVTVAVAFGASAADACPAMNTTVSKKDTIVAAVLTQRLRIWMSPNRGRQFNGTDGNNAYSESKERTAMDASEEQSSGGLS
jgi:hypothetical protein